MTDRPTIPTQRQLPEWVKQAKANQAELEKAFDMATQQLQLAGKRLKEQRGQRIELLTNINSFREGSQRSEKERELLLIQARIVAACDEWDRCFRIAEELRQAVMGTR